MASIKDVARMAGVSVGTVSNVLNRPETVSACRREQVLEAIRRLGYVRDETARHLRAGSSRTIALLVSDVTDSQVTGLIRSVGQAAEALGALVVVADSAGSQLRQDHHLARLAEERVLGVVLHPLSPAHLAGGAVPCVMGSTVLVGVAGAFDAWVPVSADDVRGGELVGAHLLARGYPRIAFVGGDYRSPEVQRRLAGLRRSVDGGAEVLLTPARGSCTGGGAAAAAWVLEQGRPSKDRPWAIFCSNDLLAAGVLMECLRRGVGVPEQVAVVGYGDVRLLDEVGLPLTTVGQPLAEMGRVAVDLLARAPLGQGQTSEPHVLLRPDLIVRHSSGGGRRRGAPACGSQGWRSRHQPIGPAVD